MRYSFFSEPETETEKKQPTSDIEETLIELGVPPHYRGYQFLLDALSLAFEDEDYLFGVTKNLYPTIAKRHCSTAARVERSIRHAIETAWKANGENCLRRRLPQREGKPTNREFMILAYKWVSQRSAEKS